MKTDYVLQTLWRDLSSSTDVVGPFYTSSGPLAAKFTQVHSFIHSIIIHACTCMQACLMDAVAKFHYWGFQTSLLIGDGASSNHTMLKTLAGYSGHYNINRSQSDIHNIRPYFLSPFTGRKLYMIICPSHMVSIVIVFT